MIEKKLFFSYNHLRMNYFRELMIFNRIKGKKLWRLIDNKTMIIISLVEIFNVN